MPFYREGAGFFGASSYFRRRKKTVFPGSVARARPVSKRSGRRVSESPGLCVEPAFPPTARYESALRGLKNTQGFAARHQASEKKNTSSRHRLARTLARVARSQASDVTVTSDPLWEQTASRQPLTAVLLFCRSVLLVSWGGGFCFDRGINRIRRRLFFKLWVRLDNSKHCLQRKICKKLHFQTNLDQKCTTFGLHFFQFNRTITQQCSNNTSHVISSTHISDSDSASSPAVAW